MPGKSRHGKGRYSSKKRKISRGFDQEKQSSSATNVQQPATARPYKPAPVATAPVARPVTTQYRYVATELRRIGILTGIILVILVVLSLFLS